MPLDRRGSVHSHAAPSIRLRSRDSRYSNESTDSADSFSSIGSLSSTDSRASVAVERWQSLPLTSGVAIAVLVATRALTVRREARLESRLAHSRNIPAGTTLIVLKSEKLRDGTRRALVSRQGQHEPCGWVSWVAADGTHCLVSRATAFRDRLANAESHMSYVITSPPRRHAERVHRSCHVS